MTCYLSFYRRLSRNFSIAQTRPSVRTVNQGENVTAILYSVCCLGDKWTVQHSVRPDTRDANVTSPSEHCAFFVLLMFPLLQSGLQLVPIVPHICGAFYFIFLLPSLGCSHALNKPQSSCSLQTDPLDPRPADFTRRGAMLLYRLRVFAHPRPSSSRICPFTCTTILTLDFPFSFRSESIHSAHFSMG